MATFPRPKGRSGPDLRRKLPQPWTPWAPEPPPPGLYDPSLSHQAWQVQTGYGRLGDDTALAETRAREDEARARQALERQTTWGNQDLDQRLARGREDIGTSRTRGGEDYERSVQMLQRSFRQLGNRQAEQARAYGVARGGASLQAARKRAENEALERQPLDTNFSRFNADLDRSGSRLEEDVATGRTRLSEGGAFELAGLNLAGTRGDEDRTLGFTRATGDTTKTLQSIEDLKRFQAVGAGWVPSTAPSNEFRDPMGNAYRLLRQGRSNVRVNPAGYVIGRTRRR